MMASARCRHLGDILSISKNRKFNFINCGMGQLKMTINARRLVAILVIWTMGGCCTTGDGYFKESAAKLTQSKMSRIDAEEYMRSEGFDCNHGGDGPIVGCQRHKSCLTMFGILFSGTCAQSVELILTPDRNTVDRVEIQPTQCFGL